MLTLLIALITSLLVGAASYRGLPTSAVVVMMTVRKWRRAAGMPSTS